jgi:hypothetical protein
MYAVIPPAQERVRVITASPERYLVHVNVDHAMDYQVPSDGRITLGIPGYRPTCGIYLFNSIKVGGADDPLERWTVTVTSSGRTVRTLSVKQVKKLPTDIDGYRLLKLPG